jgi:hypothetical protein
MIALQDLCSLLLYLAQEGGTGVCTYIATDGERYTLRRVYDALREFHAMPPGRAWWPRWVWRAACALLDWRRPGGEPSWDKLFGDELYSNELVVRATSWRPGRCLEDALPAGAGQC